MHTVFSAENTEGYMVDLAACLGDVAEVRVYNRPLASVAAVAALITELAAKWGLMLEPVRIHLDASDPSTLFADAAGTVPVAASGGAVAAIQSKGTLPGVRVTFASGLPVYSPAGRNGQGVLDAAAFGRGSYVHQGTVPLTMGAALTGAPGRGGTLVVVCAPGTAGSPWNTTGALGDEWVSYSGSAQAHLVCEVVAPKCKGPVRVYVTFGSNTRATCSFSPANGWGMFYFVADAATGKTRWRCRQKGSWVIAEQQMAYGRASVVPATRSFD